MKKYYTIFIFLFFSSLLLSAQNELTVSGTITDKNTGETLIGASVGVSGASVGAVTDIDGKYTINVKGPKSTLEFVYIGYKKQTVAVTKSGTVDVALEPDVFVLDDVVAIGYGSMKKSDVTGAIASVSGDKLKLAPTAGVDQALQGRLAGVTVNANSGQPGAAATIRIRGIGTVNDASPIFVVDGVMVDNINFLSTSDILSTEVLKDASATAIYGSRGANGVILITTKKGSSDGKTNVSYEMYVGFQNRWKKLDLMGRDDFARIKAQFTGTTSELQDYFDTGNKETFNLWVQNNFTGKSSIYFPQIMTSTNPTGFDYSSVDTDWQDAVFRKNAFMQNHYLSVDGGTKMSSYAISANYFSQDGTLIGSNFERMTLRANSSHQVRKWLKVGENLSFSKVNYKNVQNNNANSSILNSAITMSPWDPTHYPTGTMSYVPRNNPLYPNGRDLSGQIAASSNFKNVVNPFTMVDNYHPVNESKRWVGDIFVEISPLKGLTLRGDVSMDLSDGNSSLSQGVWNYSTGDNSSKNFYSASMNETNNITYEATANYVKDFDKHSLNVTVGTTREDYSYHDLSGSGTPKSTIAMDDWSLGGLSRDSMSIMPNVGESWSTNRRISALGRVFYSYDNKYLATVTYRRDGSSKFPVNNKWGNFPSMSLAWRASEEPFFKPLKTKLDMLKVRLGWGKIGNDKVLNSAFVPLITMGPTFVDYPFGKDQVLASGASMLSYPGNGKWEVSESWNLGVDFASANSKWYGNVDLYIRDTKDMLMIARNPAHVGYRYSIMANVGQVRNQGIELMLEYRDKISDLNYSLSGNMSMVHNKLTHLNYGDRVWEEGNKMINDENLPLKTFWLYEYAGVFKSQEEIDSYVNSKGEKIQPDAKPGDARYIDVNGNGTFDDSDKKDFGSAFPWLTYGFNATLDYKGFDLQLFFQGVYGNKIYNAVREKTEGYGDTSNLSTAMNDVWSESNPDGSIPLPSPLGGSANAYSSTRFLENGAYLRLKNIQLGYNMPSRILKSISIQSLRLYVSVSNLVTFTKYTGYDPEVGNGVDYGNYPQSRTFMLGTKINF